VKFLIDGIDRLGKSTLVQGIQDQLGYHLVVHYNKPKLLPALQTYNVDGKIAELPKSAALQIYQEETNRYMFELLRINVPIIFDRTHLGEMVYAPIYRGYSGDYVLKHEGSLLFNRPDYFKDVKLILLTTSDFSIMKDDGDGFDWTRKEEEQELFKVAFKKSIMSNKVMIDVADGRGGYRDSYDILQEVINDK